MALDAKPYAPAPPGRCWDARPSPRLPDVCEPWRAAPGKVRRADDAYERQGTGKVLLPFEPWPGRRHVQVPETRNPPAFAQALQAVAQTPSAHAKERRVGLEQLSTPTPAAFYPPFAPEAARELPRTRAFPYTPTHGSWLHMAEGAFAGLARHGLPQRLPTQERGQAVGQRWAAARTEKQSRSHWQFTTEKARENFKRFYPH